MGAFGVFSDELTPGRGIFDYHKILTDGTYIWSAQLPYYLSEYDCELSPDFLAHVRRCGYVVAEMTAASCAGVAAAFPLGMISPDPDWYGGRPAEEFRRRLGEWVASRDQTQALDEQVSSAKLPTASGGSTGTFEDRSGA